MLNKTPKGQASIQSDRGRLRIRFPRELFGGKLKILAIGLPDNERGWQEASRRLKAIQSDIDLDCFDESLERYKKKRATQPVPTKLTLLGLWQEYFDYKKPTLKETTIDNLEVSVTRYLVRANIEDPADALKLREWLLNNTTPGMARRVLSQMHSAFEWGMKHGKVRKGDNVYTGMSSELKDKSEGSKPPRAFTPAEKAIVLSAFSNSHYESFVIFLFLTGCRPSEAIGLRWGDVSEDFSQITFNGCIYRLSDGTYSRQIGSKNNRSRVFPCNHELKTFLANQKNPDSKQESAIFLSAKGKIIDYLIFISLWNDKLSHSLSESTPYSCRDTFITEQIGKGINPVVVARWVDNSVRTIERHYFDPRAINHIVPL